MSDTERQLFMLHRVSPTLRGVFSTWKPQRYASFGCIDCHGLMREQPSEFLPELVWQNGQYSAFVEQPEVARFMRDEVVPAMRATMGSDSLGCSGCHLVSR